MNQTTTPRPRHRTRTIAATAAAVALATTAAAVTGAWAVSAAGAAPATDAAGPWTVSTAAAALASGASAPGATHPGRWPNHHNGSQSHQGNHHGWPGGMMNGSGGGPGGMMGGTSSWPGGMMGGRPGGVTTASCTVPAATGTQVRYAAMDMGGGSMMGASMMRLMPMWTQVRAGTVTLDLVNRGTMPHELLVYPLAAGQVAGQRTVGANDRVSEDGVLGEVAPVCDQPGDVDGIAAGNAGRVSLQLQPGRYEIVCNLPGHYRAGMFATLVVV